MRFLTGALIVAIIDAINRESKSLENEKSAVQRPCARLDD